MISRRDLYALGEPLGNGATRTVYGNKRVYGAGGDDGGGGGDEGPPDVGTIGGGLMDAYGNTSATMDGEISIDQALANQQVNDYSWGYDFNAAGFSDPNSFDSFDLGNMFGMNYSQGLPTTPTASGAIGGYDPGMTVQSFMDSPFGKSLRGLIGIANPALASGINTAYAAYRGNTPAMMGSLVGGLSGNSLLGTGAALGTMAAQGKNVAGPAGAAAGGTLGSIFGGQVAGPAGAMIGGQFGSQVGRAAATGQNLPGATGPAQGFTDNGGGNVNWGNLIGAGVGALGNIYLNRQSQKEAQSNVQDLGSMFGPNSAYAQQLRQQLERRDAAAGRRSQYGPREVELQAKLAQMAAQYGPNIAQSNMAAQNLAGQRRAQNLAALYQLGRQSGAFDWAGNQLGNLFNQPTTYQYDFSTPNAQPWAEMSPEVYNEAASYGIF